MVAQITRYRFTVDEYHRMGEAGIFTEDDRVELIDGEIVTMPPIGDFHAGEVNKMTWVFPRALGDLAIASVQNPIVLGPHWEPQPDFCLLRPRPDFYMSGKPRPEDVLLVIEVSDTTLAYDRDVKIPAYGRAGILEAWLVDLNARRILVFRDPSPDGYRSAQTLGPDDRLSLLAFPGVEIAVTDLL